MLSRLYGTLLAAIAAYAITGMALGHSTLLWVQDTSGDTPVQRSAPPPRPAPTSTATAPAAPASTEPRPLPSSPATADGILADVKATRSVLNKPIRPRHSRFAIVVTNTSPKPLTLSFEGQGLDRDSSRAEDIFQIVQMRHRPRTIASGEQRISYPRLMVGPPNTPSGVRRVRIVAVLTDGDVTRRVNLVLRANYR